MPNTVTPQRWRCDLVIILLKGSVVLRTGCSVFFFPLVCFFNVAGSLDPHKISGSYLWFNEMQHTYFNRIIPAVGTRWQGVTYSKHVQLMQDKECMHPSKQMKKNVDHSSPCQLITIFPLKTCHVSNKDVLSKIFQNGIYLYINNTMTVPDYSMFY